jgi:hypothetical protein
MTAVRTGKLATLFLGLGLLVLALLSFWSTARFVAGAQRVDGVVRVPTGTSVIIVEYQHAGRKEQILTRRPIWGFFRAGGQVPILINPSVAYDPLHPEYYQPIPVTARVASAVYLWSFPVFLSVLAVPVLTIYLLSVFRPSRFQVSTRLDYGSPS